MNNWEIYVTETIKGILNRLEIERLRELSHIADYNPGENREKYLDNIIGYIKDEIVENQGYSWRDIFNEYRLLDSISSKEANIELVHRLTNDMIYKFTKHLLCNVIEGENGEPTIKNMLNWLN